MDVEQDLPRETLTLEERLVVILHHYEQFTLSEIGEALDMTERQVRRMHQQVVDRLKALVAAG